MNFFEKHIGHAQRLFALFLALFMSAGCSMTFFSGTFSVIKMISPDRNENTNHLPSAPV